MDTAPRHQMTGFPFTERSLDCLNVAWASRLQEFPLNAQSSELRRGFWANAAQAVQRKPWGGPGTLTANGVWYSFEADCCLGRHRHFASAGSTECHEHRTAHCCQFERVSWGIFFLRIRWLSAGGFVRFPICFLVEGCVTHSIWRTCEAYV